MTTALAKITPMDLLEIAIQKEGAKEAIESLAKLQMQFLDREAKIAFIQAYEEFKRNVPAIVKDSAIIVNGQERGKFAKLDKICDVLIPELLKVGITHRWKTRVSEDGKMVFCTCYLRHRLGHEEEGSTLGGGPDTSGSKNPIQAVGSSTSYLERYTLVSSCGIAIKDQDTDGNPPQNAEKMDDVAGWCASMNQAPDLAALKSVFAQCWSKAKELKDFAAKKEFESVYEICKKELNK